MYINVLLFLTLFTPYKITFSLYTYVAFSLMYYGFPKHHVEHVVHKVVDQGPPTSGRLKRRDAEMSL